MSTLGVFSTLGGYHEYTGGIPRCMWRVIMSTPGGHWRDTMSTPGDIMSTLGGVQYTGGLIR